MKKILTMALCAAMLLSTFAGCGGSSTPSSSATPSTGDAGSSAVTEYKKDIVFGIDSKHSSIDPHENSNTQHNYLFRMVFDTLVEFDNETNEIKPGLATSWESEGGIKYTFKLREDAKFHNGEPVKASDCIFTFKRAVGTKASNSLANKIANMEAPDDYTLVMELVSPNNDWLNMLTLPTAVIMSEKACNDDAVEGPGVGSGAWKIDSYKFGDYTKIVANTDYWGEKANAETFTFRYIPENSARVIALQTGEIDICQNPDPLELSYITDDPKLEVQQWKGGSLTYLAFNNAKEPMNNKDFRLAVAYGINIPDLIAVAADGMAETAKSFWGWNQFGYNGGTTYFERDVEKAKEYLAKAYPNGGAKMEISISGTERKTCAELIQSQLKEVGIEVKINELDSAGISTSTTNGEHQSCIYGMGFNIFGDDSRRILQPGSAVNKAHINNDRIMELLDLAVEETDEAKRMEYYAEIQQIVFDEAAYVPLYFRTGFFGVKAGTTGIDYYPTSHHDLSSVAVPAAK